MIHDYSYDLAYDREFLHFLGHAYSNLLEDRVKVYQILNDNKIETPRYIVCDRSDLDNMPEFEEFDDYLEINGETFHKPFVEKPVRYIERYFYLISSSNDLGPSLDRPQTV